jgi:histidinol dehydrogenase
MKKIFPELPDQERKEILAKINDAMMKSNEAYYNVKSIIAEVERKGAVNNIRYGNQIDHTKNILDNELNVSEKTSGT